MLLSLSLSVFFLEPAYALESAPVSGNEDLVVAKISGNPVTEKQVFTIMKFSAFQERDEELPDDYFINMPHGLFNAAIDILITRTILLKMAQEQKIAVSEADIENIMQQVPKGYQSHAEYAEQLKRFGISEQELKKHTAEALKIQRVISNAVKDIPEATEEEVEKFYSGRKANILAAEQVRASHIMLSIGPGATEQQKKDIKEKLEKIKIDIESGKITFAEAAKKYSQDNATAAIGGDLGVIYKGQKEKAIETVLFNTPQGAITPIIELKNGYFLLRVDEYKPKRQANLEETKDLAAKYYNQRLKQKAASAFMNKIKANAKIEMLMNQEEFAKRNAAAWKSIFKR